MENKNFISLFFSIMLLFIISACTSDNSFEQSKTENSVSQWHHAVMSLNISKENFDAKGSASTRATSDEWQDGDKLYLRFVTFNGIVIGTATYDDSKGMWNVSYNGTLNKNVESQLFVVFLDNIEQENNAQTRGFGTTTDTDKDNGDVIKLDCYHGVYMDENGTYILDTENNLKVKATLKSQTSRVRIKGEAAKEDFKLIGLNYYKSYNPNTHEFTFSGSSTVLRTSTDKDNVSKYIYVRSLVASNRQIMLGRSYEEGNYIFKAICSKDMFVVGKSGFITMPNKAQHNGWNMKQVSGTDENGHGWVDLDLPSGTIWAEENFGADLAEWQDSGDYKYIFGNQCMWGSVDYTNWSKSTTDIGGTSEDIVTKAWGSKWRIPSKEDFVELESYIRSNDYRYGYYKSSVDNTRINGAVIVGKNDEILFLPFACDKDINTVFVTDYWSSTPDNYSKGAYYINSSLYPYNTDSKSEKNCIRPIMRK